MKGNIGTKWVNVTISGLPWSISQKMKFSTKNFSCKCDQICSFLRIKSQLLKKFFMENFIFCKILHGIPLMVTFIFKLYFCAVCTQVYNTLLPLYTHIHFWATPSPTYNVYVIFLANQSLHNPLAHYACNTFLLKSY